MTTSRQTYRRTGRRSVRHQVLLPCHVLRKRDQAIVAQVAMDLSTTGLQVLTGARVLTGEPVQVTVRLPETGRWLTLEATVARVLHGRRPGDWGRRLGLELEGLTPTDMEKLCEANRRMEAHA
jgi:PilZ domain